MNEVDLNIKWQIAINLTLKAVSVLCTFLLIPALINLLGENNYGVWLTISSLATWLTYLDVGLGNGLRNKLSMALVERNNNFANELVSTTYFSFGVIMLGVCIFTLFCAFFIHWNEILNTKIDYFLLLFSAITLIIYTCTKLILDLGITIFLTLQKSYIKTVVEVLTNGLILLFVYFLPKHEQQIFFIYALVSSIIPLFLLSIANYYLFRKESKYYFLKPKLSSFNKKHLKDIFKLGLDFFTIQVIGIIIFSTDNILISHFFTPSDVTTFNIVYKYFSISTFLFSIIMMPFWAAFAKAFFENNTTWIRKSFYRLIVFWLILVGITFFQLYVFEYVFGFWIGSSLQIPKLVMISMAIYTIIYNWNSIFASFLNGVAKIRIQVYNAIIVGILNIPLTIMVIKNTNFGLSSIILVNSFCLLLSALWSPIQCYKILNKSAKGIWDK